MLKDEYLSDFLSEAARKNYNPEALRGVVTSALLVGVESVIKELRDQYWARRHEGAVKGERQNT